MTAMSGGGLLVREGEENPTTPAGVMNIAASIQTWIQARAPAIGMDQRQRLGQRSLVVQTPPRRPHDEHDESGDEDSADDLPHDASKCCSDDRDRCW